MSEPWGLSGPEFLGVYAEAVAAAHLLTAVARRLLRRGGPDPRVMPDVYTVAVGAGGRARVVDTAVSGLVEAGRVRASRDHRITVATSEAAVDAEVDAGAHAGAGSGTAAGTGAGLGPAAGGHAGDAPAGAAGGVAAGDPAGDRVQEAVLTHLRKVRTTNLRGARRLAMDSAAVLAVEEEAVRGGMLLPPGRRRAALAAGLLLQAAVLGLGVARLVNGVRLHRPVGFLFLFLLVSAVLALVSATRTPRLTRGGERWLERIVKVRSRVGEAGYGPHAPEGTSVPEAVFAVAAFGAAGVADPGLREALYGGMSASASAGSGSGGYGAGACGGGGGCGGGGCGGGGCGG
ncbi:TIGR04222 domain-containing membrane protein [Streptomyces sp. HPF1205]|uniref:TIGR04222 domain-containing membrane protein n=1 Tax=Streptomyces sp. HPF1205 TaxID=2873262 RepID=UPI0021F141CD|nr:TIGR04222 domain-containing membrane protein [Streptomyces sp. HPF1205]